MHPLSADAMSAKVRCPLSLRNVADLLHERGIADQAAPRFGTGGDRFGPKLAAEIRTETGSVRSGAN